MSHFPVVSGQQVIKALERLGYSVVRQKGSHVRLRHAGDSIRRPTSVPLHREVRRGTLLAILDDAGLSVEEFLNLLR